MNKPSAVQFEEGLERANQNDIYDSARDGIRAAALEMKARGLDGDTHVIAVMNPDCTILTPEQRAQFNGKPAVQIETRERVVGSTQGLFDDVKSALDALDPGTIPIVIFSGESAAVCGIIWDLISSETQCMSFRGMLWLMLENRTEDFNAAGAPIERIRTFQVAARMRYNREKEAGNPRPIDQFLADEFGGKAVESALRRGDLDGALDIVFSTAAQMLQ